MKQLLRAAMKVIAVSLPLGALLWSSILQAAEVSVDAIRLGVSDERTRIVFDVSDQAEYRFFRLANPQRVVIDISGGVMLAQLEAMEFDTHALKGFRHSKRGDDSLRLVMDLGDGEYRTRHFQLAPNNEAGRGNRVVVDLFPKALEGDAEKITAAAKTVPASEVSDEDRQASLESERVATKSTTSATAPVDSALVSPDVTAEAKREPVKVSEELGDEDIASTASDTVPAATKADTEIASRSRSREGVLVDFSGTWQHEWAWANDASTTQKFESILQPRWDVRFSDGLDLTAILRIRGDATGDLGPNDRKPPNYSDVSAPWYNSADAELSLRELFVDFQWGKSDWRLGKQQVVWGQADGIKVLDVVNPQSFREFILDEFDDSRIPLWTANVNFPIGDAANLQLLWIPDTTYHELAELGTPFAFSTPRIIPQVPITSIQEVDKPDDPLSDSDYGIALSGFAGGWDLSLNYLYRYLDAPVLPVRIVGPTDVRLEPEYRRSHLLGGSFSNAFGDLTLRGELAYNSDTFQPTNTLAASAIAQSEEFSSVIGLDWSLSMDSLLSAQWFSSYLFDHTRTMFRDELEQTLTLVYQQDFANTTWRFRGIAIHSVNDGDTQLQLRLSHWLSGEVEVWIGVDAFSGDSQGLFGQFDANDRALIGFEYGF